ncbi:hypothetical protein J1605_020511 [Eschrichtius robustus]|uniref:Uncharacterized protein n=1 Tax=Eschrichtius robustus TaxID=9764 RepID=A0AB34HJW9_ESCRO|nr:hypothetical protein J1605_020511 [Eschrichtius robustus]
MTYLCGYLMHIGCAKDKRRQSEPSVRPGGGTWERNHRFTLRVSVTRTVGTADGPRAGSGDRRARDGADLWRRAPQGQGRGRARGGGRRRGRALPATPRGERRRRPGRLPHALRPRPAAGVPARPPMSSAPPRSPALRPHRMKKDESFLGKLGGTLARKKKAKEGECAGRRPPASCRARAAPRPADPGGWPTAPAPARMPPRVPPGPDCVAAGATRPETRRDPRARPPTPARPAQRAAVTFGTAHDPRSFLLRDL